MVSRKSCNHIVHCVNLLTSFCALPSEAFSLASPPPPPPTSTPPPPSFRMPVLWSILPGHFPFFSTYPTYFCFFLSVSTVVWSISVSKGFGWTLLFSSLFICVSEVSLSLKQGTDQLHVLIFRPNTSGPDLVLSVILLALSWIIYIWYYEQM